MYRNNILNCQESTTIVNASPKKVWQFIEGSTYVCIPGVLGIVVRTGDGDLNEAV